LFVDFNKAKSIINNQEATAPKFIEIGNNVWLSGYSIVLGNSKIGNDCVLGACSLYYNIELNEYCLGLGNPVKRAFPIDRVLNLKGAS
jgi:acetyltransferase-like isoleucine patch superfamily enzyme